MLDDDSGPDGRNYMFTKTMTAGQTFTYYSGIYGDANVTGSYIVTVTAVQRVWYEIEVNGKTIYVLEPLDSETTMEATIVNNANTSHKITRKRNPILNTIKRLFYMDIIYELLLKVKKSPELYLGKKSIILLNTLIFGYDMRQREIEGNYKSILDDFHEYANDYCGRNAISAGWAMNIYHYVKKNDGKAFDKFYELLDEFLKNREKLK